MGDAISNLGGPKYDATESQNVTGQRTPILELSPDDSLAFVLKNGPKGIPMYAELKDSNGDDLPRDTEVVLTYEAPSMDQAQVVSEILTNIRPYRTLSLTEQQSEDYRDRVRVRFKDKGVQVRDVDTFAVQIDSSAQIDWSNSRIDFGRQHVDIVSMG